MSQAFSRVKARVPILGGRKEKLKVVWLRVHVLIGLGVLVTGSFAVWGVLFSGCDCTLVYFRKKEDPWNAIISGAATGGILAARAGLKAAGRSALAGGVILAAIEGLNVLLMRVLMPQMEKAAQQQGVPVDRLEPPVDPYRPRIQRQPLWQDESTSSSPFTAAPGYTTTTQESNPWGVQTFGLDETGKTISTTSAPEAPKSSWKFW